MTALRLVAPLAVRALVEALTRRFEAVNGLPVFMAFALAPDIADSVSAGDTPDLIVATPDVMGALIEEGRASAELHRPFGRVSFALGRACEMCDPLRTIPELRELLRDAGEIACTESGTGGDRFRAALEELGIAEEIADRLRPMAPGDPARAAAAGKVDLAALPLPLILATEGLNPVALLPAGLGTDIDFTMSLSAAGAGRDAAHDLLNHFSSRDQDATLKRHGVARFEMG